VKIGDFARALKCSTGTSWQQLQNYRATEIFSTEKSTGWLLIFPPVAAGNQ
jgi:hypothetical protein